MANSLLTMRKITYFIFMCLVVLNNLALAAAEAPQENAEKPENNVSILDIKKNILTELQGQDVELVQKVMQAIDKAVADSKPAVKTIVKKANDVSQDLKDSSARISELVKKQGRLIKNYADLEKTDVLMNELMNLYSDNLDKAIEQIGRANDKFEELFVDKVDAAVDRADELLESLYEKDDKIADQISDLVNEMNELSYTIQDDFEDRVRDLSEKMEETIDKYLEQYEKEVDKMLADKEKEFEEKKLKDEDFDDETTEEDID